MSRTARESASSKGAYAEPKRAIPTRGPRASLKAVPRARKVSSVVWWSSTKGNGYYKVYLVGTLDKACSMIFETFSYCKARYQSSITLGTFGVLSLLTHEAFGLGIFHQGEGKIADGAIVVLILKNGEPTHQIPSTPDSQTPSGMFRPSMQHMIQKTYTSPDPYMLRVCNLGCVSATSL